MIQECLVQRQRRATAAAPPAKPTTAVAGSRLGSQAAQVGGRELWGSGSEVAGRLQDTVRAIKAHIILQGRASRWGMALADNIQWFWRALAPGGLQDAAVRDTVVRETAVRERLAGPHTRL